MKLADLLYNPTLETLNQKPTEAAETEPGLQAITQSLTEKGLTGNAQLDLLIANVFCPTGPGGGVDPGCPAGMAPGAGAGWTGEHGSVGLANINALERGKLSSAERKEFNKVFQQANKLNIKGREGKATMAEREQAKAMKKRLLELQAAARGRVSPEEREEFNKAEKARKDAKKAGAAPAAVPPNQVPIAPLPSLPAAAPPAVVPVQRLERMPAAAAGPPPVNEVESRLQNTPVRGMKPLGGGINETYIATMIDGSKGVWKPLSGEYEDLRDGIEAGTYYKREAATSSVASVVGMDDLVPPTVTRIIDGEPGSLQKFVPDAAVANEVWQGEKRYDGEKDLARAAAFDLMIGNTDRHAGNWMLQHANGPGPTKIALIDNGLAIPTKEGQFRSYLHREAASKNLPIPEEVLDWDPVKIRAALEKHGIEEPAIKGVERRLSYLKDRAAIDKPFRSNDADRIKARARGRM